MATIGASRLERVRRERGLSQRELAEAAGTTRQAIGAIESGRMQPGVAIAIGVARALDTTVEALFGPEPASLPSRMAAAVIRGRTVRHALTDDRLAVEPAESIAATAFLAGCDVAVGLLARHASARSREVRALWLTRTNRASVEALAAGAVHAAVVHGPLADLLRDRDGDVVAYALATTEEGWLVPHGNPLGMRGARDLISKRARIANRPLGAGARSLLDETLTRAHVDANALPGYGQELAGQLDAGRAVAQGYADAAIGTASVARIFGLDFLPLRSERCTLLVMRGEEHTPEVRALLDAARSTVYRRDLDALDAYDTTAIGEPLT
jgi:molybdate-binding protein/DNA-binding XRE family transcriptional regulator